MAAALCHMIPHRICGTTIRTHNRFAIEFQRQSQRTFLSVRLNIREHPVLIPTYPWMVMPRRRIHKSASQKGASLHFANLSQFPRLPQKPQKTQHRRIRQKTTPEPFITKETRTRPTNCRNSPITTHSPCPLTLMSSPHSHQFRAVTPDRAPTERVIKWYSLFKSVKKILPSRSKLTGVGYNPHSHV